jgi:NADPH:quinone reductase-like Zn-dependent oxidoreductase
MDCSIRRGPWPGLTPPAILGYDVSGEVAAVGEGVHWRQIRIEVVAPPKVQTPPEELVQDLLSIVTVFSGRLYGSRAKQVRSCVSRALKACLKAGEGNGPDCQDNQTPA